MKYLLPFTALLGLMPVLTAQQSIFLGKLVDESQQRLSGVNVSIEGGNPTMTDDDGLFRIALSKEDERRSMVTLNVPGYKILSPTDGEAVLPRSQDWVTTFTVKKTGARAPEVQVKELENKIKKLSAEKAVKDNELERRLAEIESLKKTHQTDLQIVSAQVDSLNKVIERLRTEGSNIERSLSELALQRKQLLYGELSQTLLNYLDKLKNLRDWMPRISDLFLNDAAITQFNAVISSYNGARDTLYNKHEVFEKNLGEYWQQESLVLRMEDVNGLALNEIHQAIVMDIINQEILTDLKDYATRQTSRITAMKKAEKSAKHAESMLYVAIPKLEDKINQLLDSIR